MQGSKLFETEKPAKILLKLAPPVMFAHLIQSLYNIIDSLFVGRYSDSGLTALSIVYPAQLLMLALAVGTGVGINTVMAAKLGRGSEKEADEYGGVATPLAVGLWFLFALTSWIVMPGYAAISTASEEVIRDIVCYGRIVSVFSIALFLESAWTKILQANGDMRTPMVAQIAGALVNIALDPLLIFGIWIFPEMGIAGAAAATIIGQVVAALIVFRKAYRRPPALELFPSHISAIFRMGLPNILMQAAYTFYIFGLNLILSTFSDQAVTALGIYYKWQTFFFIPLGAMQTCIVPIVSFNYAARKIERCSATLKAAIYFGWAMMALGALCFVTIPAQMLKVFTSDADVTAIGTYGFRYVGISFIPMVTSLIFPVFLQAVGASIKSSALTVIRTVVLFVPLGFLFSKFGLERFWLTFPVTETLTTIVGIIFYKRFMANDYAAHSRKTVTEAPPPPIEHTRSGIVITIAREHGSGGKEIGRAVAGKLGIPCYYKEMIDVAAHESGLDRDFISNIHKNAPAAMHDLYLSTSAAKYAVSAQEKAIRKIAEKGSCVIVGRAADEVLCKNEQLFRVFVRAPKEFRIKRLMAVYGDSRAEAEKNIRRSDRARAAYYRHLSGHRWGDPQYYELVVDSSCGVEEAAEIIVKEISS